jgi:hypothetical protein
MPVVSSFMHFFAKPLLYTTLGMVSRQNIYIGWLRGIYHAGAKYVNMPKEVWDKLPRVEQ